MSGRVVIWSSTQRSPLVTLPNSHVHGMWVATVHPQISFLTCPQTLPPPSFWSPSWLSLLKLQLITEYEGWGCLYPPSLLDFPLHLKNYSWRGFETRPLPRVPGKWLSKPESLLNHRHLLATTKAAYSYSCILFFFNLSIFFILYF